MMKRIDHSVKGAMALFGAALLVIGLWACTVQDETSGDAQKKAEKRKQVKVSRVKALPPRGSVEYVGVLSAFRKANVSSETGGTIERLYFEKGDHVRKGQLLAEINTTSVRLQVRTAKATLEEARAALVEAENNYKRIKELHGIHAVSNSEFDTAKRSIDVSRANVEKAEASLAVAKDYLRKSRILAPCDGTIAFREVEEGEVLVIPPATIITQVVDLARLKIKVSLGEKDMCVLEKRKRFSFSVDAIPGATFTGRLSFRSPAANSVTRSFPIELEVENRDPRMADGMTARVSFPLVDEKKTIKVPSAWLSEEEGAMGLYVVKEGKALFRQVTLGAYYDQRVEILSGLGGDEQVITNPAGLKSGDPVSY
ncbi:MAG: efflux RND transporter periplasmic adaptor subunit [Deltaproteobacteria bacterium]|nr:efflux RND transporter periplasmic adaptor subunit [Deltaproteobacteria bacterium]